MQFLRALSIVLMLTFLMPQTAGADLVVPGAEPLTVTITPQYPRPYDTITITPKSNLIDLSANLVTIAVNGEVIETGSGGRSATAQVGGPGSSTRVTVTAKDVSGQEYIQEIILRPADIALIIDSISTSHPFYQGAQLVAPEGRVRLVAIPDFRSANGSTIPTQNLVYSWKVGDKVLQDQSGIGRSVLDAVAPVRYRDARITVTISTQDKSMTATALAIVSPVDPIVRVYRTSPLLGPSYERAITGTVAMSGDEDTFRVVPYFFKDAQTRVAWTVNGVASETSQDMTVRVSEPGQGTARIGVSAQTPGAIAGAETGFSLTFGSAGGGLFGL